MRPTAVYRTPGRSRLFAAAIATAMAERTRSRPDHPCQPTRRALASTALREVCRLDPDKAALRHRSSIHFRPHLVGRRRPHMATAALPHRRRLRRLGLRAAHPRQPAAHFDARLRLTHVDGELAALRAPGHEIRRAPRTATAATLKQIRSERIAKRANAMRRAGTAEATTETIVAVRPVANAGRGTVTVVMVATETASATCGARSATRGTFVMTAAVAICRQLAICVGRGMTETVIAIPATPSGLAEMTMCVQDPGHPYRRMPADMASLSPDSRDPTSQAAPIRRHAARRRRLTRCTATRGATVMQHPTWRRHRAVRFSIGPPRRRQWFAGATELRRELPTVSGR